MENVKCQGGYATRMTEAFIRSRGLYRLLHHDSLYTGHYPRSTFPFSRTFHDTAESSQRVQIFMYVTARALVGPYQFYTSQQLSWQIVTPATSISRAESASTLDGHVRHSAQAQCLLETLVSAYNLIGDYLYMRPHSYRKSADRLQVYHYFLRHLAARRWCPPRLDGTGGSL